MALEQPADIIINSVQGVIESRRYFGETWSYRVRVRGDGPVLSVSVSDNARLDEQRFRPGSPVWLLWDSAAAVVLDH
jgi:ABC-type Fe3+/spermidine/putrescine transport system ATPase subunit